MDHLVCDCSYDSCPLRVLPALRGISKEIWDQFFKLRTLRSYARGNILFYEGNRPLGMYFLCSGRVKITKSDSRSHPHIPRIAEAPDFLGDRAIISGEAYLGTSEVMEESRICFIESRYFEKFFLNDGGVCRELARRFAQKLGQAEIQTHDLASKTIRARVAKHLLKQIPIQSVQSVEKNVAKEIRLKESQSELAEILGASPEAVCRSLAEFRAKGLISNHKRMIRILDGERLRRIAEM